MTISLQKGQKIDLTKGNAGLSELLIGLGWDPVQQKSQGGFFSKLLGGGQSEIDCDASALLLDANGKITRKENIVYFANLTSGCGSVKHSGDNLTGDGDGDDEQILVSLRQVPSDIHKIMFVVTIYDCQKRGQDFGMIANAFIRVIDNDRNTELAKFNLTEDYSGKTTLLVGEVYRHGGEWKFAAVGEGTTDVSLGKLVDRYI